MPVSLPARLAGQASTCLDVSLGGAAFLTFDAALQLNSTVPLELRASDGASVTGVVRVRSIVPLASGGFRVGGSVTWSEMAWLAYYGAFVHTPKRSQRSHAPTTRAAA